MKCLIIFFSLVYSPFFILLHVTQRQQQEVMAASPLNTVGRWIIDEGNHRVKLCCVNWASHLEPMVTEGLSKQPLYLIVTSIKSMGFNCVRLTWATDMVGQSITVEESFQRLNLHDSLAGIRTFNPWIVNLSVMDAFKAVVSALGKNNVMVILDNHISKPGWCCSDQDGNGFFGDEFFDPDKWLSGLQVMARLFDNGTNYVVGMSLRNELRGSKQNTHDWYKYMQLGAETIHKANPNVLVIFSGLNYDLDLLFLIDHQPNLTFTGKLVFELHWYAFSDGNVWATGNLNEVCGRISNNFIQRVGFLLSQQFPLLLSEFGVDQRDTNVNDNRFLICLFGTLANLDMDWALWALQGDYYLSQGITGVEEVYGVLDKDWQGARNPSLMDRISGIQSIFKGPSFMPSPSPDIVFFHPATGLCIQGKSVAEPLKLGSCIESESRALKYVPDNLYQLRGTSYYLQADGLGSPTKVGTDTTILSSKWTHLSDSTMHLASTLTDGTTVCLDIDDNSGVIITDPCKCLSGDSECDPVSQWFKYIEVTGVSTPPRSTKSMNRKSNLL